MNPEGQAEALPYSGSSRTRVKSNKDAAKTDLASQRASQESGAGCRKLARVVTGWSKLPAGLKAAIVTIVDSATPPEETR